MNVQTKTTDDLAEMLPPLAQENNVPAIAQTVPPTRQAEPPIPVTGVAQITKAIAAVMKEIDTVAKQGTNKFHGYRYARMEDVLKEVTPLLGRHGIVIFQNEISRSMFDNDSVVAVQYAFTVAHESGEVWPQRLAQTGVSRCRDSKGGWDDKSFNKCHTAARKYFLLSLFQIPTGQEDDADRGSREKGKHYTKAQARDGYSDMQAEIANHLGPVEKFREWMEHNAERISLLPLDWQDYLRLRCQEKLIDLREAVREAPVVTDLDDMPESGPVVWDEPPASCPDELIEKIDAVVRDAKWDALTPAQQAGILCGDAMFRRFLTERRTDGKVVENAATAALEVRLHCLVQSRADIKDNHPSGRLWRELVANFRAWQRDLEPAGATQEAATPASVPSPADAGEPTESEVLMIYEDAMVHAAAIGQDTLKRAWLAIPKELRKTPELIAVKDRLKNQP